MSKPIIFFCHSAVDKDYLTIFQNQIKQATTNAVAIFQSSDGESVSFGNNWVHKLEESLNEASITFVFVSPESLSSHWIQFEAGLSYGRGISVVPVGIKGVDVATLSPPLSLLQGFNLSSKSGMNNVISIINKELDFDFVEEFDETDFHKLTNSDEVKKANLELLDSITLPIHRSIGSDGKESVPQTNSLEIIKNLLEEHGHLCARYNDKVLTNGLQSFIDDRGGIQGKVQIDPFSLQKFELFINKLSSAVYTRELEYYWFDIYLEDNYSILEELYKLSGRLESYGITHSVQVPDQLKYKGLRFFVERERGTKARTLRLCIVYRVGEFLYSEFIELIQILRDARVIYSNKEQ